MMRLVDVCEENLLSPEVGKLAFKLHTEVLATNNAIQNNFLYMGKLLYIIGEKQLYRTLGYNQFEEYLNTPELGFSRGWAYSLMKIHKKFILDLNREEKELLSVGVGKLSILIKHDIINSDNVDSWLTEATGVTKEDLQLKIDGRDGTENELPSLERKLDLRPGFYKLVRYSKEPYGDFVQLGKKQLIIGRDDRGLIVQVVPMNAGE